MRILVTNDDGVHADGIFALKVALEPLGEVFVVAPERPRSAAAHAITLHKPVRLSKVALRDGSDAYAISGTPADCVVLGTQAVMDGRTDLVVSGINHGPNLGWDVHYSGTVAAAKEAAMTGHPAIAISVASYGLNLDYCTAAAYASVLAKHIAQNPLPIGTVINVNVPYLPASEIAGVAVTFQGPRQYVDRFERRVDPAGRDYYWLGGTLADARSPEGSDVRAISESKISVTPLQLDATAYDMLSEMREWTPATISARSDA
jgi:5'-nucleotidase